jgi:hypothetical protein
MATAQGGSHAMRLIVGTSGKLIDVELDQRFVVTRETVIASGHHYGIALLPEPDNAILCKHHAVVDRFTTPGGGALQRSSTSKLVGDVKTVHQIACADGGLYVANTGGNSVIFQGFDGRFDELHLGTRDRHVNSVFPCALGLLVMFHNKSKGPSEVAVVRRSPRGLRLAETIRLPHRACHNIFLDGPHLLYNASEAGQVVVLDLVRRRVAQIVTLDGHTKGMSVTADHVVVGCSPQVTRKARTTSAGGLVVLDRRTLAVVSTVELGRVGPVGNVNEIRALDGLETAHAGEAELPDGFRSFALREPGSRRPILRMPARLRRHRRDRTATNPSWPR